MSRKREKPSSSSWSSFPKRRRPLPLPLPPDEPCSTPATILVIGLPSHCSVLDLKSRFEIYGSISRTRIDPQGLGFLTFRSKSAAESAVSAALDPSFGVSFASGRVQVVLATDSNNTPAQQRGGIDSAKEHTRPTSKLLRPDKPLSRHGRAKSILDASFKTRQIVAYDDLL